jgi:hypothetical protein
MAFKTLWEAQANLPQALRSVTSVQLLKAANEKHSFSSPINNANVRMAMTMGGSKATFKKHPDAFGSYIQAEEGGPPRASEPEPPAENGAGGRRVRQRRSGIASEVSGINWG